jgi:cholesterol oxidase
VFTDSNIVCYERLRALGCDHHELKIYPGYGHQDVFMGQDVARDCFPAMLEFIRRHSEPETAQAADQWAAA